ncbi:LOW QUALITY PROTEIN: hypothetical protein Sjap_005031 [Stephania japonica]|uniref:Uncharacterized protein n=1 Tax=Stephania japonica TaxID=461633 RepID=A0AAP0K4U3_9MAGN
MASSPLHLVKTSYHTRSVSLPSRPSPLTVGVEQQLQRLRSNQDPSTSAGLADDVKEYMICQKKLNKIVHKCVVDLKKIESKHISFSLPEEDPNVVTIVGSLREMNVITTSIFKSLLSSISPPRKSSWSIASKLMNKKRQGEDTECFNDVEKADVALSELMSSNSCKDTQNSLKQLEALEMSVHGLEDELE